MDGRVRRGPQGRAAEKMHEDDASSLVRKSAYGTDLTDGKPVLETIPGAGALKWVSNTESPLFKLDSTWYVLIAGRWFTTRGSRQGLMVVLEGPAGSIFRDS